jgi:hypothetical protein
MKLSPAERLTLAEIQTGAYVLDTTAIGTSEGHVRYCVGVTLLDAAGYGIRAMSMGEYADERQAEAAMRRLHDFAVHARQLHHLPVPAIPGRTDMRLGAPDEQTTCRLLSGEIV